MPMLGRRKQNVDAPRVVQDPSRNGHVMIPHCSTFWPLEDVGINGYCYGWVLNPRLVCVAGVLQVGSLGECLVALSPAVDPPGHVLLNLLNVTRRARRSPPK